MSPETLRRVPLWVAIVAALALAAAGLGTRAGLWHFSIGFQMLRWAGYAGLAAGGAAILMFFFPRLRTGGLAVLLCAVLVGAMVAAVPLGLQKRARAMPVINEVTTDPFKASPLQRQAYPDIQPLIVDAPPGGAFATAKAVAQEMGWEIVREDAKAGTIEAVATTFWFGFKDDVEIRVSPQGTGSRVDLRSRSRVGKGDAGANAKRVRGYLARFNVTR
jgi:uncharacterized protein (DUF1499 family)